MNEESKHIPGTHGPPYHLHAYIWVEDSFKKNGALEAMVTADNKGITAIESWDRSRKTDTTFFKPLKVNWDPVGAGGHFTLIDKKYAIQVIDDVDDHYQLLKHFKKTDSTKNNQ